MTIAEAPAVEKSVWEGFPDVRPYNLISQSRDLEGREVFVLPPNPAGNPFEMLMVYNWPKHEDLWLNAMHGVIPGLSPDGRALLEHNYRTNKRRTQFKHDWRELWGRETGKTCLFLCPGPSLGGSLPEIAQQADKRGFFTLGINRTLTAKQPLDYYYVMDRRAASDGSGYCDWLRRPMDKTTLVASTTALSELCANFRHSYWGEHHATLEDSGRTTLSTSMVITMCDALMLAYKLGAKEIWIYGSDFALSGGIGSDAKGQRWEVENYYHDLDALRGLEIRKERFPSQRPIRGINDRIAFVNWELICYAAYATCMAMMLSSVGVEVRNKTPQGILWETWR
jgi:hypothetical protein